MKRLSTSNWQKVYFYSISIFYIVIRWIIGSRSQFVLLLDSYDYLHIASKPINWQFFFRSKPVGASLFYKLIGNQPENISIFQLLFSIASWLILAFVVTKVIKTRAMQIIGFSLVLLLSFNIDVLNQTHVILSESISTSLFILFLASSLMYVCCWKISYGLISASLGFLWAMTKESNVVILGGVALILIFIGIMIKSKMQLLWIGLFFIFSVLLFQGFSIQGMRWRFPLLNIIAQRVLQDKSTLAYFEDEGMPISSELMDLSGKWGNSNNFSFLNSSKLRHFQKWLSESGKLTYYKYLISHPRTIFIAPILNISSMMEVRKNGVLFPSFFSRNGFAFFLLLGSAFVIVVMLLYKKPQDRFLWFLFMMLVLVYPNFIIVWIGDAMDYSRHALGARLFSFMGILLSFLFFFDYLIERFNEPAPIEGIFAKPKRIGPVFSDTGEIIIRSLIVASGSVISISILIDFFYPPDKAGFFYIFGNDQTILLVTSSIVFTIGLAILYRQRNTSR